MLEENITTAGGNTQELLTPTQLSEWLHVSQSTVYKWVHYGFIPHIKLGKLVRFERFQVERWYRRKQKRGRERLRPDMPEVL